jgi:lipopolysaccharide heptosyltransferase II
MKEHLQKVLCIRADNMGDLLMSSPAIRALKDTFKSHITVLTSSLSTFIAESIKEIDEVITYDLPWVKTDNLPKADAFFEVVDELKSRRFDAAVIFTVYSQNPLPAAMLAYLAGIPVRVAYCRENPYDLLTHWVPDPEPYSMIRHQVRRDLDLVATLGAITGNEKLILDVKNDLWIAVRDKLNILGVDQTRPFIILHPGVSEKKREYPPELWIEAAKRLSGDFQLLITGGSSEKHLTEYLAKEIGEKAFSLGGKLDLNELVVLISHAPLIVSVNTGTIHLAAAVSTPVVVLYALTNPQHLPWKVAGKALLFDVPEELKSKNEVIRFVNDRYFSHPVPLVNPEEIVQTVYEVLSSDKDLYFPEMLPFVTNLQFYSEKTK